jgi:hypothetical protein
MTKHFSKLPALCSMAENMGAMPDPSATSSSGVSGASG